MRIEIFALLTSLALEVPSAAGHSELAPSAKKRVLVYTVSAGFEHDVVKRAKPGEPSLVESVLVEQGQARGWFECVLARDAADFTTANLAKFDLVFFYTTGELPFSEENRRALMEFVKQGKAFAGAHCATDTFYAWPEYGALVGAYFDGHPWHENVVVRVDDRLHAATRHLGERFEIVDEIYQFKAPYDRSKLNVLLSLDPARLDATKAGVNRKDGDFAIAWTRTVEKGRMFYTALGHRPEVWADARFLEHLTGGFAWAMRCDTKPAAPGPKPEVKVPEPKSEPDTSAPEPPGAAAPGATGPGSLAVNPTSTGAMTKTTAKPTIPPGFAVDLVAEAPEILWPSAVVCLDDGTLLVGEDRMDMPGPADQPVDRLIALHFQPDGSITKTIFADRLFAVMGLELVDGAVYVMNMPHLTRLCDADGDGVAEERTEVLSDLGPPAPGWPGGFNDHIVSGIRLGLDGFLYVAVGDKGIPHAHGTDGSELTLRGGGVIRVRPDGTRLEIVATGLRNILDIAMDERGELFTYDNTDDGLGWWTRLTHVVPGGHYGYPWDYKEHPERMLPCMADYGGGSPCGGLVYREAAWPEEFRGNLIYCEWGKSMLRRFVLEPKGATFGVKVAEDFVTAGDVRPFKPFDVCESPDGRFLYFSDWAYEGWTAKAEAGRIWRLRRADDDLRIPSRMRPMPEDAKELGRELGDPSFRRRLRAQRALAAMRDAGLDVAKPIAASWRGSLAQPHAIWATAEGWHRLEPWSIDFKSQPHTNDAWTQLCRAESAFPERVRADLAGLLISMNPSIAHEVARAAAKRLLRETRLDAGSAGGTRLATLLASMALVPGADEWGRFRTLRALRDAGIMPAGLSTQGENAKAVLDSLRDGFDMAVVTELRRQITVRDPGIDRPAVLDVLASCARMEASWDGKWWNIQPAKTPRPRRTVDWKGTREVLRTVRSSLHDADPALRRAALGAVLDLEDRESLEVVRSMAERDGDPGTRMLALDALGALKDEDAAPVLERIVREAGTAPEERQHAIEAACAIRSKPMLALLRSLACDERAVEAQSVPCIEALARLKDAESVPRLVGRTLAGAEPVRCAALKALARIQGKEAGPAIAAQLGAPSPGVRIAACRALAEIGDERQVAALVPLVRDPATRAEAVLALARTPALAALPVFLDGIESSEKRVLDASHAALLALRDEARGELEKLHGAGMLGEKQLAAVQQAFQAPQPVMSWHVLGPFERIGEQPVVMERGLDLFQTRQIIDPEHPSLAARYTGRKQAEFGWRETRAAAKTGFVDLREVFEGFDEVTAFAFARVTSAAQRKAELRIGSDDMAKVWLNGVQVHAFDGYRAWTEDEDKVEVELHAGENALLVLVSNAGGGWSFDVKLSGEASGPLFERRSTAPGLEDYRKHALEQRGDPQKGYALFRQTSGAMCIRCHTVYGEGAQVGPDVSDIAAKYGKDEIVRSLLEPSQRIAEGYNAITFELDGERLLFGQVQRETADSVVLFDTNGETKTIEKSEIVSRATSKTSVMPDGLALLMSKDDFADLVAYLMTLRGAPK